MYTILKKTQSPRISLNLLGIGGGRSLPVHSDPGSSPESQSRTNELLEVKEPVLCTQGHLVVCGASGTQVCIIPNGFFIS